MIKNALEWIELGIIFVFFKIKLYVLEQTEQMTVIKDIFRMFYKD